MDQTERITDTFDTNEPTRDTKNAGSDTDQHAKPAPGDGPNKQADNGGARHNDAPDTLPARAHYSGGNGESHHS